MRIVAIGSHPDDIELGCGATLLKARQSGAEVTMLVLTDGSRGPGDPELRAREQHEAAERLGARLVFGGFRDGELVQGPTLIDRVEQVLSDANPDVVFTHAPNDSHQDHAAAAVATLAAARVFSTVLHYESPSTLEFHPTVFADVTGLVPAKLDLLRRHVSQIVGAARVDLSALTAQARFRGFQARVEEAEGFVATRSLLELTTSPFNDDLNHRSVEEYANAVTRNTA